MLDFTPLPQVFPPQMIAALAPQSLPLPVALAEPALPPVVLPEPALLALIDALCLRFALPIAEDAAREALAREAEVLRRHSLADLAYLGCAAACLARVDSPGAALVPGIWAGSALLAHVGAVLPGVPAVAGPDELAGAFLAVIEREELPALRLLVGGPLPESFLGRLEALAAIDVPFTQTLAGGGARLMLAAPDGASAPVLELIPSPLLGVLRAAILWADRADDARFDLAAPPAHDAGAAALLVGEWPSLLPLVPPGLPLAAPVDSLDALIARCTGAAAAMPIDARAGLAVHLSMVWMLAGITAAYPVAGWAALLDALPPTVPLAAAVAAAARAGVPVLLSSLARSEVGWTIEMAEDRWALRAGLAPSGPLAAPAVRIVQDRAAQPYASLFDLLHRVPALAREPQLALRLVLAGALDELHDRRALLAHWLAIDAWCARLSGAGAESEPEVRVLDEVPDLAGPGALPERQLAAWAQAFAPLPGVAAPDAIEAALLPAAAQHAALGERTRVAGAVRASRTLRPVHGDEMPLALVELTDGRASIQALIAIGDGDGDAAPPAEGTWLVLDLLVAEREGIRLLVQQSLAVARAPRPIAVSVPVQGDREADLARVLAVRAILARHPGGSPAQVALLDGGRRRVLQLGELRVRWGGPLRAELEALLGAGMAGPVDAASE